MEELVKWLAWFLGSGVLAGVIGFWLHKSESKRRDRIRILEQIWVVKPRLNNEEFLKSLKLVELYYGDTKRVIERLKKVREFKHEHRVDAAGYAVPTNLDQYEQSVAELVSAMSKVCGYAT